MKKIWKSVFACLFVFMMILPTASCGQAELQQRLEEQQSELEGYEARLKELSERLETAEKGLEVSEKEREALESENEQLQERVRELKYNLNKYSYAHPYEIGAVGISGVGFGEFFNGRADLLNSSSELDAYLNLLDEHFQKQFYGMTAPEEWSMNSDDGNFNRSTLSGKYNDAFFEENSLIICNFTAPNCIFALENIWVWRDRDVNFSTLKIEIDYSLTSMTAEDSVMVLLEMRQGELVGVGKLDLSVRECCPHFDVEG